MEAHTMISTLHHPASPNLSYHHDPESDFSNPYQSASRTSTDSQTQLLLPPPSLPTDNSPPTYRRRAQSYAPSINSFLSTASTLALTPSNHQQRGFRSRESYLAALNEFAERKSYMEESKFAIKGVYGETTMDEYKAKLGPTLREQRRRRKAEEAREKERLRRVEAERNLRRVEEAESQEDLVGRQGNEDETESVETLKETSTPKESRMRKLSRVLIGGRRNTVA